MAGFEKGQDEAELERLAAELARLPDALDSFFAIETTGELPGPGGVRSALTVDQRRLLERTAVLLGDRTVVNHVRNGLSHSPDPRWRETALWLMGLHASSSDLSILARLLFEDGAGTHVLDALIEPFQEALTRILRRDGSNPRELSWLAGEAAPLTGAIVRAVGMAGDPAGLPWLALMLEDPDVDRIALQEIGRLAPGAGSDLATETSRGVRPLLRSDDASLRKQAIRALGALGDPASIPHLVRVLDQANTDGERKMALAALRRISGVDLPELASAWQSWYGEEQRWFQEEGTAAIQRLSSEDEAEVVAAIHRLSERSLYRERIAAELAPLLAGHSSPTVRGQVCLGLARLGSDAVIPELIGALEDEDLDVRHQAHTALCAIADLPLPPDREAWIRALEKRR